MESRLAKFAGVIVLSVSICGQGLAQSSAPAVPNLGGLESSATKLAIAGTAATVAVSVIALVAHHHHKNQSGKEKVSKNTSAGQGRSSTDVLKSGQLNTAEDTKPADNSQGSSSQLTD